MLTQYFDTEIRNHGPWEGYQLTFEVLAIQVVPKILEPLQADGRVLKPRLLHCDLWEGNCATNPRTGGPTIFDSAAFHGHNEQCGDAEGVASANHTFSSICETCLREISETIGAGCMLSPMRLRTQMRGLLSDTREPHYECQCGI